MLIENIFLALCFDHECHNQMMERTASVFATLFPRPAPKKLQASGSRNRYKHLSVLNVDCLAVQEILDKTFEKFVKTSSCQARI